MENKEVHIVCLEENEFDYISLILNTLYKDLKKFPKKYRTDNFNILEKLIKEYFFNE